MIMSADPDPHLCSTSVVEDIYNHDDVVGLKLSYMYHDCIFTVLVSDRLPQHLDQEVLNSPSGLIIRDLITRFNEACTCTDRETLDDIDQRLDPIWQEVEDLVRSVAFKRIRNLHREHDNDENNEDNPSSSLLADYLFPRSFILQILPEYKGMNIISRPDLPCDLPFAIEPEVGPQRGILNLKPEDVKILRLYRPHVLKVRTEYGVFCCKLNNAGGQNSFMREFETLKHITNSSRVSEQIRIPRLRGVVEVEGGVVGLLMDLVDTDEPDLMALLRQRDTIPDPVRHRWANQISATLKQLHQLDLTWGDAKTSNVLIDSDQNAWLIDFGGGFTRGWVDEALYDTQAGDLKGLENTLLDVFGKR